MTWIWRRPTTEPADLFRQRIANVIERIDTHEITMRTEDLEGSGRTTVTTGLGDGDRMRLFVESDMGRREQLMFGDVAFRRLTSAESLRTGKQWIKMTLLCVGLADEGWNVYAFAVRTAPMTSSERTVRANRVRAFRHDFDLVAAARAQTSEAAVLSAYLQEHHVTRSTLTVFTAASDGRLLKLQVTAEEFTTCMKPSRTHRSVIEYHGFGVAVPELHAPLDDYVIVRIAQRADAPDEA